MSYLQNAVATRSGYDPRVYVACLASYNNGILYGAWIDADQDAEDIKAEIVDILAKSPAPGAEEYAVHDYEDFAGLSLGEYDQLEHIALAGRLVSEYGEAFALWLQNMHGLEALQDDSEDKFLEEYVGEYESCEDYARQQLEDRDDIPPDVLTLIDYAAAARNMFMESVWSARSSQSTTFVYRR